MRVYRSFSTALLGAVAASISPAADACAVCFGRTDSPLAQGMNWGIAVLLAFILVVMGVVGGFAMVLARRSAAMEQERAQENRGQTDPI